MKRLGTTPARDQRRAVTQADVVLQVALDFATGGSESSLELAETLDTVGAKLIETGKGIRYRVKLLERLKTCNQDGCDEPAVFSADLPGRNDPAGICAKHAPWAREVYDALGWQLRLDPIEELRERLSRTLS